MYCEPLESAKKVISAEVVTPTKDVQIRLYNFMKLNVECYPLHLGDEDRLLRYSASLVKKS